MKLINNLLVAKIYLIRNKLETVGFKSECYVYFKKRKGIITLLFIFEVWQGENWKRRIIIPRI